VAEGSGVFAVNAGFVVLGTTYVDHVGHRREGLGILDVAFSRGDAVNAPVVVDCRWPEVPTISAYESHLSSVEPSSLRRGDTRELRREGRVLGITDGATVGTFLHGPVLGRNQLLADAFLRRCAGIELAPAPEGWAGAVRMQRIREDLADPTGWGGVRYGKPLRSRLRRR